MSTTQITKTFSITYAANPTSWNGSSKDLGWRVCDHDGTLLYGPYATQDIAIETAHAKQAELDDIHARTAAYKARLATRPACHYCGIPVQADGECIECGHEPAGLF